VNATDVVVADGQILVHGLVGGVFAAAAPASLTTALREVQKQIRHLIVAKESHVVVAGY
jgi:hypothetical protein